ncbi:PDZ domain-containing protein [Sporomusa aerivorans]|uniref:PDZ domain-containing protein n=1 Tax=Sporomusa aerivorans TaxID=204936 RepID=UPI00352A61B1
MFPWSDITLLIVRGALGVLFDFNFWLILALVGYQYWQMQKRQRQMFGVYNYTLTQQMMLAGAYGLLGGIAGSWLLTLVGVTLNQLGLNYIWPVALALMLVNMRFLCFAYAGGLVALSNVLFGWPNVNVPQVLALVAVLHITESLLIAVSGGYSAMPMIIKRADGRLVGAFSLQNFWPLPLVILAAVAVPESTVPGGIIKMPEWWPLLPLAEMPPADSQWIYVMAPVVAALGYTDMAIASLPRERRRRSALHLAAYSIILLIMALMSAKYPWLQAIAAIMSPVGHEFLIQLDNRREMEAPPRFVPPPAGLMVLDTVVDTPTAKVLVPGDIILSLGSQPVNSRYDLAAAISYAPEKFSIVFERNGKQLIKNLSFKGNERRLGVILVPDGDETVYAEMSDERYGLIDWLKDKYKKR